MVGRRGGLLSNLLTEAGLTRTKCVTLDVVLHVPEDRPFVPPNVWTLPPAKERKGNLEHLVPLWLTSSTVWPEDRSHATGICNSTHTVRYFPAEQAGNASGESPGAIHVFEVWANVPPPPLVPGRVNMLLHQEPFPHLSFEGVDGFQGLISYSQSSTIWTPLLNLSDILHAGRRLRSEPTRRAGIGIWVDNCGPRTRTRLIDELLASGLPVTSYGSCRQTKQLSPPVRLMSKNGTWICQTHRLMLAIENVRDRTLNGELHVPLSHIRLPLLVTVLIPNVTGKMPWLCQQ